MKNPSFTIPYNFRKTFRRFRGNLRLTYQQYFFLAYIVENGFTEKFRVSELLVPNLPVRNTFYYVKVLSQKGFINKTGNFYSLSEKGKEDFKKFMGHYNYLCSNPFTWK
jgi:hypothetical protein